MSLSEEPPVEFPWTHPLRHDIDSGNELAGTFREDDVNERFFVPADPQPQDNTAAALCELADDSIPGAGVEAAVPAMPEFPPYLGVEEDEEQKSPNKDRRIMKSAGKSFSDHILPLEQEEQLHGETGHLLSSWERAVRAANDVGKQEEEPPVSDASVMPLICPRGLKPIAEDSSSSRVWMYCPGMFCYLLHPSVVQPGEVLGRRFIRPGHSITSEFSLRSSDVLGGVEEQRRLCDRGH